MCSTEFSAASLFYFQTVQFNVQAAEHWPYGYITCLITAWLDIQIRVVVT